MLNRETPVGDNVGDKLEGVCGVDASLCALCGSLSGQVRSEKHSINVLGFKKVFCEYSQRRAAGKGQKCLSYPSKCEIATHLWPFLFFFIIYTCEASMAAQ